MDRLRGSFAIIGFAGSTNEPFTYVFADARLLGSSTLPPLLRESFEYYLGVASCEDTSRLDGGHVQTENLADNRDGMAASNFPTGLAESFGRF